MKTLVRAAIAAGVLSEASAGELPLSLPVEFEGGQLYVNASINGSEPVWFIVDSGASGCVVDKALAERLRLDVEGSARGTGAGRGDYEISFAPNVTYGFAGADLTVPKSYVIDLSGQPTLVGRHVGGILGYEFFERYVVSIDFASSVMTLEEPAVFDAAGRGAAISLEFVKKTPHTKTKVKVAGAKAAVRDVLIDLGSGDAVDVDALASAPRRLEVIGGVGLGEEFRTVIGRAEWAEIGPYRLEGPYGATGGVQLIGLEALRRFDVTFDYSRKQMFLLPNEHFNDPFNFDASGLDLRLTEDGRRLRLHDVAAGSPGAEAGLLPADEIIAINNQPTELFTIAQARSMLTKAGSRPTLTIERGGERREVVLSLRNRL